MAYLLNMSISKILILFASRKTQWEGKLWPLLESRLWNLLYRQGSLSDGSAVGKKELGWTVGIPLPVSKRLLSLDLR